MDNIISFLDYISKSYLWGKYMPTAIIFVGAMYTVSTGFFQFTHIRHWFSNTFVSLFKKETKSSGKDNKQNISQFQSICTALGATVGTGNIAGVSSAIVCGGPGAVFWMWAAAFLSMMTIYAENVLGIFYRRKSKNGTWCGGAMYYLKYGVGSKKKLKNIGGFLAAIYAFFTIAASFGMGNLVQINTISVNMKTVFDIDEKMLGIFLAVLGGIAIVGGIKSVASFAEKLVPFMVIIYISASFFIIIGTGKIAESFFSIVKFAFGIRSFKGAAVGIGIKHAVSWGIRRGVFSNEACLGSSASVAGSTNVTEPVKQGMWGIFAVFTDTIVVCSATALVVLSSGYIDLNTGLTTISAAETSLVTAAFISQFGKYGGIFMSIAIFMFAFSTVLGWSCYGLKSWEYLFGDKTTVIYKLMYILIIYVAAIIPERETYNVWVLSDMFNALMAIVNIFGLTVLCGTVCKITDNYKERVLKKRNIRPMLSAFDGMNLFGVRH